MLIFSYDDVLRLLPAAACVRLMRETLADLEKGISEQYLRTVVKLPKENYLGLMPAYLNEKVLGAKIITIFHGNTELGLPSHQGMVLLFDSATGEPLCAVDGNAITRVRTGAVSAVATDLLARQDATKLAIIGAGTQGRSHLNAILSVRQITQVSIFDKHPKFSQVFAAYAKENHNISVRIASSVAEAVADADIICTVTPSHNPLLFHGQVKEGCHINAVGASTPDARELDTALVQAARFYGDNLEAVMNESGDFLIPLGEGAITKEHFIGELGALICGKIPGRQSDNEITIFDSLGIAVEDLAAALYVYSQGKDR